VVSRVGYVNDQAVVFPLPDQITRLRATHRAHALNIGPVPHPGKVLPCVGCRGGRVAFGAAAGCRGLPLVPAVAAVATAEAGAEGCRCALESGTVAAVAAGGVARCATSTY